MEPVKHPKACGEFPEGNSSQFRCSEKFTLQNRVQNMMENIGKNRKISENMMEKPGKISRVLTNLEWFGLTSWFHRPGIHAAGPHLCESHRLGPEPEAFWSSNEMMGPKIPKFLRFQGFRGLVFFLCFFSYFSLCFSFSRFLRTPLVYPYSRFCGIGTRNPVSRKYFGQAVLNFRAKSLMWF